MLRRAVARDPLAALLAPDHRLSARKRIRLETIAAGLERKVAFEITDPHVTASST